MKSWSEGVDLAVTLQNVELIESCRGPRQDLTLLRHAKLGLVLVIDGELQHIEAWQALYHEPLVHVSGAFVPELRNVLILGGGSLFAAAESLRYPTVERCTLVDHDPAVLALMARHYPHARQVLADKRFEYISSDVIEFLQSEKGTFDLIVNDCLDLIRWSSILDLRLFSLLRNKLAPEGVCADLVYRHMFEKEHLAKTRAVLRSLGPSAVSLVVVPEYPGVLHLLTIWGSEHIDQNVKLPRNKLQLQWCRNIGRPTFEFYDPGFLPFHLYLPPLVERAWRGSSDESVPET